MSDTTPTPPPPPQPPSPSSQPSGHDSVHARGARARERLKREADRLSQAIGAVRGSSDGRKRKVLLNTPEPRVLRDARIDAGLLDGAKPLLKPRSSSRTPQAAAEGASDVDAHERVQRSQAGTQTPAPVGATPVGEYEAWWQRTRRRFGLQPVAESVMPTDVMSFDAEAEHILSRKHTRRSQRIVHVALAVTALLLLWAALAKVDEVTKGDARVISSKQLQVVQSLDGGVVSSILVREGDVVQVGQLLLRIDETRATSGVRESAAQGVALKARAARLRALAEGKAFVPPAADNQEERDVIAAERRLYENKRSELQSTLSVVRQQMAQRQNEVAEANARRAAAQRSLSSTQQELDQTRPLLASGAVSQVDVLRLEREISRFRGDMEQAAAQAARAGAAIGESQRKQEEVELSFRNEAGRDLAETTAKLNALNEGAVALADRVDKAQVKSPVRGRIQRLMANTVGGVVSPGKDLVEIVPLDDTLVLEARVSPRDIAFIRPDQAATVKFTAYDYAIYGTLDAKVENISPDAVVDEKGNSYYLVRVRTTKPTLGNDLPIIPGMTAEVDVLTGRKTVLSYLMKPVLKVQSQALRER